jgi:hypothetical protein
MPGTTTPISREWSSRQELLRAVALPPLRPPAFFWAVAETCLQGLVFGSVFPGRPDEHGSDDRQRYEDHDERDDSGNAGHSPQSCTDVSGRRALREHGGHLSRHVTPAREPLSLRVRAHGALTLESGTSLPRPDLLPRLELLRASPGGQLLDVGHAVVLLEQECACYLVPARDEVALGVGACIRVLRDRQVEALKAEPLAAFAQERNWRTPAELPCLFGDPLIGTAEDVLGLH